MRKLVLTVSLCIILFAAMANDIQIGIKLFESKNYLGARKFFTESIQKNPGHHISSYYLGRIDFEECKFAESISHFDRAISLDPNNYLYFYWRGRAHLDLLLNANLMMKAIYAGKTLKDFEKAVELNSEDLESRVYLAEYYGRAPSIAGGSIVKSIAHFKAALSKHPLEPYLYLSLGKQYMNAEKHDSSFYYFRKGVEINPNDPMIRYELGKAGAISGRELVLAEKSLTKSLEGGLDNWHQSDAYYQLGRVREQLNNKELAKIAYQECLKINGGHLECKKALRKLK
jgi:tetratricopeptide (TPR) repeat protein